MRRLNSYFITAALLSTLVLGACSNSQPPPAPPPVAPTATGPSVGAIGANLEDPSPGTPLSQNQNQEAVQALLQNLNGYGQATIQTQLGLDYVIQSNGYQPGASQQASPWTHLGQPQQEPIQMPTYQLAARSGAVQFYSRYEGSLYFSFVPQLNLGGLVLHSTDQVALFEGSTAYGGYAILKIAYRTQNPLIQYYEISQAQGSPYLGGSYGPRYHVTQRVMATTFAYPQQQQQPQGQPTNYQPYDYYGWN